MNRTVLITAHSGCEGTPDGSMESIKKGADLGADCVEIDVRRDGAGKLWLTHDLPESFSGLVPLEEAFALIRERGITVNCDVKEYGALLPALELAEKADLRPDRLVFSGSVDTGLLSRDPDIARRCTVYLNSEELVKVIAGRADLSREEQTEFLLAHMRTAAERLRDLRASALNAPYTHTPDGLIERLRDEDIPLSLWTLNDPETLRAYMGKGLLNITTRIPSAALRIRGETERGRK